jgi:hypothetical protein
VEGGRQYLAPKGTAGSGVRNHAFVAFEHCHWGILATSTESPRMGSNLPQLFASTRSHPGDCPPQEQGWGEKVSRLRVKSKAKTEGLDSCSVVHTLGVSPMGGKGGDNAKDLVETRRCMRLPFVARDYPIRNKYPTVSGVKDLPSQLPAKEMGNRETRIRRARAILLMQAPDTGTD